MFAETAVHFLNTMFFVLLAPISLFGTAAFVKLLLVTFTAKRA